MGRAKQPVSIETIEFDALIGEETTREATVPEYAVEDGFCVSDTIVLGAEPLTMTLFVTDTPVTWLSLHQSEIGRAQRIKDELEDLFFKKTPVTVSTTNRTYTDMAIESISFSRALEVGYAYEIPITFRKIRITKTKTTTIPDSYGKSGKTATNAGTASTSKASSSSETGKKTTSDSSSSSSNGKSESKSSLLYSAANSLGLL